MNIGTRIIYNPYTGTVLNNSLYEMSGSIRDDLRPERIEFIDLPYGYNENNFKTAIEYHVDVETKTIVVDAYIDPVTGEIIYNKS